LGGLDVAVGGRGVSVEMKQRKHVTTIMLSNDSQEDVLFEGNLGQLIELSMLEDSVLEVKCVNGVLRVDLALGEIEDMASRIRSGGSSGSKLGSTTSTNKEVKQNE
jgi:hypothetical protein